MITYFGTYTLAAPPDQGQGSQSAGIYVARLDEATGQLEIVGERDGIINPSFQVLHPNGKYLYSVSEREDGGEVIAMSIDRSNGALTIIGRRALAGKGSCHVSIDPSGEAAYVANYWSGTVGRLPIAADGTLGPASETAPHRGRGPHPERQNQPHAHAIRPCPAGKYFYVADLGIDKLMVYQVDAETRRLVARETLHVDTVSGAGPRHLTFHPNNRILYLINELNSTIDVMTFDADTGVLGLIQTISTLATGDNQFNTTAELVVHPSQRWLYASNRGANSLAIYEINEDFTLKSIGWAPTRGDHPRNFNITVDGRWLVVANQFDNMVVVMSVNTETGALTYTGSIDLPQPSCVTFLSP